MQKGKGRTIRKLTGLERGEGGGGVAGEVHKKYSLTRKFNKNKFMHDN